MKPEYKGGSNLKRRDFLRSAPIAGLALTGACAVSQAQPQASSSSQVKPERSESTVKQELHFSKAEYDRRYSGIRKRMQRDGLDAILVTGSTESYRADLGHLKYLGAPIDAERTYLLVPLEQDPILFNRIPGFPVFKELGPGGPPVLPSDAPSPVKFDVAMAKPREGTLFAGDHASAITERLKTLGLTNANIGIASMRVLPADVFAALNENLPNARFIDAERLMMEMRYYKSPEEQAFLRRSGAMADLAFSAASSAVKIGANDIDVYYAADRACVEAGGPLGGFQLISSGPWGGKSSNPIFQTGSQRVLQNGDLMIPEIGSDYKGYFTQLVAPVSIGEPTDEVYEALQLCEAVRQHNLDQLAAGKTVREIDQACLEFTKDLSNGEYGSVFGVQAGEPELTFWHDDYELKSGSLAYNQPFLLPLKRPGGPFHMTGDAVLVTETGTESLHKTPMEMLVV